MTVPDGWEELLPPRHLADRVVDAIRRRRWVAVIAVGLAVLTAVGVLAVVAGTERRASRDSGAGADVLAVYAAAIAREQRPVYVPDPLPAEVRREVGQRFGARVHFATPPPVRNSGEAVVSLRSLVINGTRAQLDRDFLCGPLCGQGDRLTLVRGPDGWRVSRVSPSWVS